MTGDQVETPEYLDEMEEESAFEQVLRIKTTFKSE